MTQQVVREAAMIVVRAGPLAVTVAGISKKAVGRAAYIVATGAAVAILLVGAGTYKLLAGKNTEKGE